MAATHILLHCLQVNNLTIGNLTIGNLTIDNLTIGNLTKPIWTSDQLTSNNLANYYLLIVLLSFRQRLPILSPKCWGRLCTLIAGVYESRGCCLMRSSFSSESLLLKCLQKWAIYWEFIIFFQEQDEILVLGETGQLELYSAKDLFGGDSLKINYLRVIAIFRHGVENVSLRHFVNFLKFEVHCRKNPNNVQCFRPMVQSR